MAPTVKGCGVPEGKPGSDKTAAPGGRQSAAPPGPDAPARKQRKVGPLTRQERPVVAIRVRGKTTVQPKGSEAPLRDEVVRVMGGSSTRWHTLTDASCVPKPLGPRFFSRGVPLRGRHTAANSHSNGSFRRITPSRGGREATCLVRVVRGSCPLPVRLRRSNLREPWQIATANRAWDRPAWAAWAAGAVSAIARQRYDSRDYGPLAMERRRDAVPGMDRDSEERSNPDTQAAADRTGWGHAHAAVGRIRFGRRRLRMIRLPMRDPA